MLSGRRHWLLFAFLIVTLVAMLMLQGLSAHTVGAAGTGSSSADGPAPLAQSGPVLIYQHGHYRSLRPRPDEVALSFDDGPSARYTPQILRVLRRDRVPATFFLIGTHAVQFAGLVRQEHEAGYELGNHTYTHVNPAKVPRWEASVQADLTESAVGGITGVRPRLLRPPYSSTRRGYVIALSTLDTQDWARPGVRTILANAMPRGHAGAIILMHDGGGNRAQTVAALRILIPRLRARGYRFATVSGIVGLPRSVAEVPVDGAQRLRGELLVSALHVAAAVTQTLTTAVLVVGVLTLGRMLLVFLLARRHARRGAAVRPAGVDRGARLQRAGGHRALGQVACRQPLPGVRGDRGGRRLERPHGRHRGGACAAAGPSAASAQRGKGRRAQPRHRRRAP
jgi:peptidoglycan/xylan/chitin deacetylase (PgdA/CDA1 family)